jgi:hypothetical protein
MKDKITLTFGISEIVRIKQILIDEDRDEALKFIEEFFKDKIRDAEFGMCEPLIQKEKVEKIIENVKTGGAKCCKTF